MPRVGVLSGTFNPPTRTHVALGEEALRQLSLGEVVFVLPEVLPHKELRDASLEDRAEMLLRAISRHPKFSAAITTHGLFLDIHTTLVPHFPVGTAFYFLTGEDAAERILLRWPYEDPARALAEMFARFELGVAARSRQFSLPAGSPAARYAPKIHLLSMPLGSAELSASLARLRLAQGLSIAGVVEPEVATYIDEHRLYRSAQQ